MVIVFFSSWTRFPRFVGRSLLRPDVLAIGKRRQLSLSASPASPAALTITGHLRGVFPLIYSHGKNPIESPSPNVF